MIHPATWEAPRIWPGEECYIIGGGPSVKDCDLTPLHTKRVIAVNNAFTLGPWPVMFYGDCRWEIQHRETLRQFSGLRVHGCSQNEGVAYVHKILRIANQYGIHRDPAKLCWNLSSGACAINLAVHFGVKRIVLIGFDMQKVGGESNYHRDHDIHKATPKQQAVYDPYERFLAPFPKIAEDLSRIGVECVNATPGSALTVFPTMTLEEALR